MNEQYLVDTQGKTIGIVLDPATYQELVQAREELRRIRATQTSSEMAQASRTQLHSIRELRGLGKEIWVNIDVQKYIQEERDAWHG